MEIDLEKNYSLDMNNLTSYIMIFDDVLNKNILNTFKKICQTNLNYLNGAIVQGKNETVDKKIRNVGIYSLSALDSSLTMAHWASYLQNIFQQKLNKYSSHLKINQNVSILDIQILKYKTGGHYQMHTDHGPSTPRTLSLIYFVNDNYKGGNLSFGLCNTKGTVEIEKVSNRLIIWPSNFMYPHTVTPVTKGERYSVVSWAL